MSIDELMERVRGLTGPDREVDAAIHRVLAGGAKDHWYDFHGVWTTDSTTPPITASLDAAVALVKRVLPGWGYRVATCCVSDDAWLFPDYNCPIHGERLKLEVSEDIDWIEVTDIDLRPPGREPIALVLSLLAALQALKAKEARDDR
ncbi:hypothetical protein [Mesorhizobium sp. A556]